MSLKRSFNATQLTPVPGISCNDQELACALTSVLWYQDRFWLLGREGWCCALSTAVSTMTFIHEWTAGGTFVGTHAIPLPVDPEDESRLGSLRSPNNAPEVRDMAADGWMYDPAARQWQETGGQAVFIGSEEGIYVARFDSVQGQWELWDRIERQNGTATVAAGDFSNPIRGPGLAALRANGTPELPALDPLTGVPFVDTANAEGEGYMAVAYDPRGNGGAGSFWVGADDGFSTIGIVPLGDPRGWRDPTDPNTQRRRYPERGGTGMWTGSAGGSSKPILEIDLRGNILTTLHNGTLVTDVNDPLYTHWDPEGTRTPGNLGDDGLLATGGEWVAGGLELDPLTGNLWVQMSTDQQLFELDTVTGDATGFAQFLAVRTPDRAGGITGIPNGDPDPTAPFSNFFDLAVLTSTAGDDFFRIHRTHMYAGLDGLTEPRLLSSMAPSPPVPPQTALPYTSTDTINLFIDETGRGSAAPNKRADAGLFPALVVFDINAATTTNATTDLTPLGFPGVLPGLVVHSFLSNPDLANPLLVGGVVPYLLGFPMPTDTLVPLRVPRPVRTGHQMRMQAIYFDSRSPYTPGLMVTNQAWFAGVGLNEVLVEAVGADSSITSPGGFFRIHYLGGPAIEVVRLDLQASGSNPDLLDAFFDVDNPGMGDWMVAGRGWDPVGQTLVDLPGCDGTWRQDSDLTTGLLYATEYDYPGPLAVFGTIPQHTAGPPAQAGSASCDFYVSELGYEFRSGFSHLIPNFPRDLIFQFTDFDDAGDVFRFDCDTDLVSPASGEGHFGMVVMVVRSDGSVRQGELLLDQNGGRAFIGW